MKHPTVKRLGNAGQRGQWPSNTHRDVVRAMKPKTDLPDMHTITIPMLGKDGETEFMEHPVLYPHQVAGSLEQDFEGRFADISGVGRAKNFWDGQIALGNPKLGGHPMKDRCL